MQVQRSSRSAFAAAARGLTLIEACVVLCVVSILAGAGAPNFKEAIEVRRMESVVSEVMAGLQLARSEAAARNEGVRWSTMSPEPGLRCVIVHTGSVGSCVCDSAGTPSCAAGGELIASYRYPKSQGITVTSNSDSIRFEPSHGMVTPTATITTSSVSNDRAVRHVVNIMGRVRTCVERGSLSNVRRC